MVEATPREDGRSLALFILGIPTKSDYQRIAADAFALYTNTLTRSDESEDRESKVERIKREAEEAIADSSRHSKIVRKEKFSGPIGFDDNGEKFPVD